MLEEYKLDDEKGKFRLLGLRQRGSSWRRSQRPLLFFPIFVCEEDGSISLEETASHQYKVLPIKPTTKEEGRWRWSKEKISTHIGMVIAQRIKRDSIVQWDIFQKDYLLNANGEQKGTKPKTIWDEKEFNYQNGTNELKELFDGKEVFDFPKPVALQKRIIELGSGAEDIILDFFAGSCTTAHAVLNKNMEDDSNRKFIIAQLPEPCEENTEAFKAGYKTIADVGKERIRQVIKKSGREQAINRRKLFDKEDTELDLGFKVFKLDRSNFRLWDSNVEKEKETLKKQLELHVDHVDTTRSQEDILYEILLKSGFPLTTKIDAISLEGKRVFCIAEGAMLICLEGELTAEVIKSMAEKEPSRVVCLDEGFKGNDQLKTNAVQIMKSNKVTSFRTV